jgi:hypothetical protein
MMGVAYLLIRAGLSFKYKGNEFRIGNKKNSSGINGTPYSPHRNCPYNRDIVILLNDVNKLQYEKFHLIELNLLKEQMKYAEQKIDYIRSILQKQFLQILQKKDSKDLTSNISFLNYKNVLRSAQMEILDQVRHIMRENHLSDISEETFQLYCEGKFDFLSNEMTDLLNSLYVFQEEVTREELYDWNKQLFPDLRIIVYDIFQTARRISVEHKVKVMEIDERIERLIRTYI